MASKNTPVREGKKIVFSDGKTREVFPVSIKNLRKMMKVMEGLDPLTTEMTGETITTLLDSARIVLTEIDPVLVASSLKACEKRDDLVANGKEQEAEDVEDPLEDVLDIATMNKVIAAGMGTDPNL